MAKSERERILTQYRNAIVGGMATTLWIHAYIDWAMEDPGERNPDFETAAEDGIDLADLCPETPDVALEAADDLAELYESEERDLDLVELYVQAVEVDTGKPFELDELIGAGAPTPLPGQFGEALANMALSTGTSWFDDHKRFELARPSFECHYDGESLTWSGRAMASKEMRSGHEKAEDLGNTFRITTTFDSVTPEENGDDIIEDHGWEDEEGVEFVSVREAIEWLRDQGPLYPSSSSFHDRIWYTQTDGHENYRTGERRRLSFHVTGATLAQQRRIFDAITKAPRHNPSPSPRVEWRDGRVERFATYAEARQHVIDTLERRGFGMDIGEADDPEGQETIEALSLNGGPWAKVGTLYGRPIDNPAGRFTAKGEQMYRDIKAEYEAKGDARAAEIAARTVYAESKRGVPGLLNVGVGRPPGVPNPGRFRRL